MGQMRKPHKMTMPPSAVSETGGIAYETAGSSHHRKEGREEVPDRRRHLEGEVVTRARHVGDGQHRMAVEVRVPQGRPVNRPPVEVAEQPDPHEAVGQEVQEFPRPMPRTVAFERPAVLVEVDQVQIGALPDLQPAGKATGKHKIMGDEDRARALRAVVIAGRLRPVAVLTDVEAAQQGDDPLRLVGIRVRIRLQRRPSPRRGELRGR